MQMNPKETLILSCFQQYQSKKACGFRFTVARSTSCYQHQARSLSPNEPVHPLWRIDAPAILHDRTLKLH